MPGGFGYGDRFKKEKNTETPGPGAYDPKDQVGFKADPKSGFAGGERFSSQELEQSAGLERPSTPPRLRQILSPGANRKFSWAAQRIHELQEELAQSTFRCKELEEVVESHQKLADDLNISIEKARNELEQVKVKLQQSEGQRVDILKYLTESQAAQAVAEGQLAAHAGASECVLEQLQAASQAKRVLEEQVQELLTWKSLEQSESTAAIEGLRSQVNNYGIEIEHLQQSLSKAEQALVNASVKFSNLQNQLDHSCEQAQQLSIQVDFLSTQLNAKCAAVTIAEQKFSESTDQLSQMLARLKHLESSLQSTAQRCDSLQAYCKMTKKQLKEAQSSIEKLQAQEVLLLENEAVLKQQTSCLGAGVQDVVAYGLHNLKLSIHMTAEFETVLGEIAGIGHRLKLTVAALNNLQQHHKEVSTALEQKTREEEQLEGELLDVRKDFSKQGELVQQLTDSRGELLSQLEHLHSEYSQLQVDMVNENMKAKQLVIELDSKKALLRSALDESATQHEANESLAAEIDQLKAELGTSRMMQSEMDNMRNELVEAYQQVSRAHTREQESDQQVSSMKKELAEVQLCNASVDQQVHMLQQLLEAERERAKEAWQRAKEADAKVEETQTLVLEMHRLMDDNELLAGRLAQIELDLKELLCSSGTGNLGHNNPKQKIQYHLKLKQELEELRSKCTWLLREKFHLEQCVRYLSVRARLVEDRTPVMGGRERKASELVLPASLAPTHLTATPLGQKAMKAGARSRNSTFSHQTREQLEEQISYTRKQMVKVLEAWKNGLDAGNIEASSPVIGTFPYTSPARSPAPSPRSIVRTTTAELTLDCCGDSTVEQRILARVASVMSPMGGTGTWHNTRSNSFRDDPSTAKHKQAGSTLVSTASDCECPEDVSGKNSSSIEKDLVMMLPTTVKGGSSRIPKAPFGPKM